MLWQTAPRPYLCYPQATLQPMKMLTADHFMHMISLEKVIQNMENIHTLHIEMHKSKA